MTREDIIRMAREAGISKPWDQEPVKWETLERFAALVAAAEREACAKLAVEESEAWHICSQSHDTANMIAAAIRARGENSSLVVHPSDDDWYYANKLKVNND